MLNRVMMQMVVRELICLVCVGLWVEDALADVPATPPDHDVDPSVEVDQRREGDHRCGGGSKV